MKKRYWIIVLICALGIVLVLSFYISNPWNARRIGDDNYTQFLRDLPLKRRGSLVHLHIGRLARLQFLSAAVLDLPILSRHEQCADVTMRIRAEYLWKTGQYEKISFISVSGKEQKYSSGESREKFESYLKSVYCHSNTESVFKETQTRNIKDVRPGDILVYPSRHKGMYGHAILVADVARYNSGKIAILCIEGNTPAREAHVVRNMNPFKTAWHTIGEDDYIKISVFRFRKEELRRL